MDLVNQSKNWFNFDGRHCTFPDTRQILLEVNQNELTQFAHQTRRAHEMYFSLMQINTLQQQKTWQHTMNCFLWNCHLLCVCFFLFLGDFSLSLGLYRKFIEAGYLEWIGVDSIDWFKYFKCFQNATMLNIDDLKVRVSPF